MDKEKSSTTWWSKLIRCRSLYYLIFLVAIGYKLKFDTETELDSIKHIASFLLLGWFILAAKIDTLSDKIQNCLNKHEE